MTHPTQEDDVKALKDALALGPQAWDYDSNQTPFYNDPEGHSRGGNCDGTYTLYGSDFEIDGDTYEGPTLSERCKKADAKFINACNPDRIARLLARLEQAERIVAVAYQAMGQIIGDGGLTLALNENRLYDWLSGEELLDPIASMVVSISPDDDAHIAAIASEAKP